METQITVKQNKQNKKLKNGEMKFSLDQFIFPPLEKIMAKIKVKLGERPQMPLDLPKGNWSGQAVKVLEERYLRKDDSNQVVETPDQLVWRVAWEIAGAEASFGQNKKEVLEMAKNFYVLMSSGKFLPNSPTLLNAGTGNHAQYSGCFVLPVDDSLISIFDALKYQALIHQSGGGTGFSFSRLRPKGSRVRSSNGVASGPVSFMKIFDASTDQIKQGGKRRGANMGILRIDHPDILEFIHCKENGGITNFNISVAVTDKFIEALKNDQEYEIIDPHSGEVVNHLSAKKIFEEISQNAWAKGDPGMVFIDRINDSEANPVPALGPIEATNPCGEQPLYPFDACNLGSIFLQQFVSDNEIPSVNWDELRKSVRLAVRFLDDVIEVNPYPLADIRRLSLSLRRIGLGVGGWADMLLKLKIPYNSEEALELAEKVMKTVSEEAARESEILAKERGMFPLFPFSIYKTQKPRRNAAITTIAPTGTISIIANCSSGIEPLFALAYKHVVKENNFERELVFFNPELEKLLNNLTFGQEEIKNKISQKGYIGEEDGLPENIRKVFVTAHEIEPQWHIRTQAIFQKYTDNAVSKTINLKNEATLEDVKKAYLMAYETGCKGITVFRDGCLSSQVLNMGTGSEKKKEEEKIEHIVKPRPLKVEGATYKVSTPLGTAFITVNHDTDGNPFEIFVNIGRAGSDVSAMAEALGRMISLNLRFGNHLLPIDRAKDIVEQLKGIGGSRSVGFGINRVRSLPDAIAKAVGWHFGFIDLNNGEGHLPEDNKSENKETQLPLLASQKQKDLCPSCGEASFVFEEGCKKCHSCGFSEC